MKWSAIILATATPFAWADVQPAQVNLDSIVASAESCAPIPISSGQVLTGMLDFGDCTLDDGGYVDFFTFQGLQGDFVELTLRPIGSSPLREPLIALFNDSDTSAPSALGGSSVEPAYVLSGSGPWTIGVASFDAAATGEYLLHMQITPGSIGDKKDCIFQLVRCGQRYLWNLGPESCRFRDSNNVFASLLLDTPLNGRFDFEVYSDDFAPVAAIYDRSRSDYVAADAASRFGVATVTHRSSREGTWDLIITRDDNRVGTFLASVVCSFETCRAPIGYRSPDDMSIEFRGSVELSVSADGSDLRYSWYDITDQLANVVSNGPTLSLQNVTETRLYQVSIRNECGIWNSQRFTVKVEPPRRRPVSRR